MDGEGTVTDVGELRLLADDLKESNSSIEKATPSLYLWLQFKNKTKFDSVSFNTTKVSIQ